MTGHFGNTANANARARDRERQANNRQEIDRERERQLQQNDDDKEDGGGLCSCFVVIALIALVGIAWWQGWLAAAWDWITKIFTVNCRGDSRNHKRGRFALSNYPRRHIPAGSLDGLHDVIWVTVKT